MEGFSFGGTQREDTTVFAAADRDKREGRDRAKNSDNALDPDTDEGEAQPAIPQASNLPSNPIHGKDHHSRHHDPLPIIRRPPEQSLGLRTSLPLRYLAHNPVHRPASRADDGRQRGVRLDLDAVGVAEGAEAEHVGGVVDVRVAFDLVEG